MSSTGKEIGLLNAIHFCHRLVCLYYVGSIVREWGRSGFRKEWIKNRFVKNILWSNSQDDSDMSDLAALGYAGIWYRHYCLLLYDKLSPNLMVYNNNFVTVFFYFMIPVSEEFGQGSAGWFFLLHRVAIRITQSYSAGGSGTAPLLVAGALEEWSNWLELTALESEEPGFRVRKLGSRGHGTLATHSD